MTVRGLTQTAIICPKECQAASSTRSSPSDVGKASIETAYSSCSPIPNTPPAAITG